MRTDRGLNLKSKKQFGHSCSDFGHSAEHAESTHFFLTLWLQDLYSMEEAKPGCTYPVEQDFFFSLAVLCRQPADPGKGRWEAGVPLPALTLLCCVSLGESFLSPSVQTQMLMLSMAATCLFIHLY